MTMLMALTLTESKCHEETEDLLKQISEIILLQKACECGVELRTVLEI